MDSKKHIMNEEPEEYVQVVFTNLIKKSKTNDCKEQSQTVQECGNGSGSVGKCKFEASGVIVNGHTYHFNLKSLIEKEPSNNLLNIHAGEIKKRVNEGNHTIEYMEPIPDFNLIIDYINGYDYKDFDKVFKMDYSRYERFRLLLTKLGMTNLIIKFDWLYPLLNINGIRHTVSRKFINTLEPYNHLFDGSSHFRDYELFNEYFRDYLLGKKTIIAVAANIFKLKQKQEEKDNNYTFAKISEDLDYYGLSNLKKQVLDSCKTTPTPTPTQSTPSLAFTKSTPSLAFTK